MSSSIIREKHIDRVLSEEFECSKDFVKWFCGKVFGFSEVPEGNSFECKSEISQRRSTDDQSSSGETDIHVEVKWETGELRAMLIEDKITADSQDTQPERYKKYRQELESQIAPGESNLTMIKSVLVCPQSWTHSHTKDFEIYDSVLLYEKISEYFRNRVLNINDENKFSFEIRKRLLWRATLFENASTQKVYSSEPHLKFTEWNEKAADIVKQLNLNVELIVSPRTKGKGEKKDIRFIEFKCDLHPLDNNNLKIKLKTGNEKKEASISLEIPKNLACDYISDFAVNTYGLVCKKTAAGTLMINKTSDSLGKLTILEPADSQKLLLEEAANSADYLRDWWNKVYKKYDKELFGN